MRRRHRQEDFTSIYDARNGREPTRYSFSSPSGADGDAEHGLVRRGRGEDDLWAEPEAFQGAVALGAAAGRW